MSTIYILEDGKIALFHADGTTDYPSKLADGRIIYKYPERVNPLVRAQVQSIMLAQESDTLVYEE